MQELYIRLKRRARSGPGPIRASQVAEFWPPCEELAALVVGHKPTESAVQVSALRVVAAARDHRPQWRPVLIGPAECVVADPMPTRVPWALALMVSVVLFVGAGAAMMNFQADVNMAIAHQRLHWLLTGIHSPRPLIIELPYALGVALGIAVFFNHLALTNRREPSPLDLEATAYADEVADHMAEPGGDT
ncbi:MAG: hypothetical protein AB1492_08655 [Bacillota bacterium]